MIWHLVAVLLAGLSMGGVAFFLRRASRGRIPKWLIPMSAGLGMLGYLAYYDYTWFDWKQSQLPAESVVFDVRTGSDFFRPWTYLIPSTASFSVLDGRVTRYQQAEQQLVHYIRYSFFKGHVDRLENQAYLLNCTTAEQVMLDASGHISSSGYERVARDSLLYQRLCP